MSRIELDASDRALVDHARNLLAGTEAANRPADEAAAEVWKDGRVGKLQAAIDILLRVIDGGKR